MIKFWTTSRFSVTFFFWTFFFFPSKKKSFWFTFDSVTHKFYFRIAWKMLAFQHPIQFRKCQKTPHAKPGLYRKCVATDFLVSNRLCRLLTAMRLCIVVIPKVSSFKLYSADFIAFCEFQLARKLLLSKFLSLVALLYMILT